MKKVALITGGSRGIGLGIARALAAQGVDLAVNGVRPEDEVAASLAEIRQLGAEACYCRGSIALSDERKSILRQVRDHYGRLDILINNAGIAPRERRDVLETTEDSFDEVVRTNLKGTYFLTQEAANWMIAQKRTVSGFDGCIVNISSISATVVSVNRGEYCGSKAGVGMITQLFAARLGEFDIPVYEVRPGVIQTDMTSGVQQKYDALFAAGLAVQARWGQPADVGTCVAAIVSGAFPYSTGQVFMVDGGLTMPRL